MKKYDVVALGEILIDFTYHSTSENGDRLFEQNPGGAPANLLSAVQKLGGKTAFIGKVGKDMHGKFLKKTLEEAMIETKGLRVDENYFTTLAFVNLSQSGERSFSFARKLGADTQLHEDEIDYSLIENTKVFHIGSLSLTDEPAKTATYKAIEFAKAKGITVSYDPNYREKLWKSEKDAKREMRSILKYTDIIKISDEEMLLLTDKENVEEASEILHGYGISIVIITLGSNGAYVSANAESIISPCVKTEVVDTTGAGDSFFGGFLYCLTRDNKNVNELTKKECSEYADFSNKVASICVSRRGAIKAMPSINEVNVKRN